MDPAMSKDIEATRDMVNRFMQTEVVPVMDGYEKRGQFPRELIQRPAKRGCTARCSLSLLAARTWATSPRR